MHMAHFRVSSSMVVWGSAAAAAVAAGRAAAAGAADSCLSAGADGAAVWGTKRECCERDGARASDHAASTCWTQSPASANGRMVGGGREPARARAGRADERGTSSSRGDKMRRAPGAHWPCPPPGPSRSLFPAPGLCQPAQEIAQATPRTSWAIPHSPRVCGPRTFRRPLAAQQGLAPLRLLHLGQGRVQHDGHDLLAHGGLGVDRGGRHGGRDGDGDGASVSACFGV